jgi:nucleotide-binding universal stress UspA family protein
MTGTLSTDSVAMRGSVAAPWLTRRFQVSVVVGYVPTREGRAALSRACAESLLRRTKLIVINSNRGGKDFDTDEAGRFEAELLAVQNQLDEAGVEHEVRQLVRGNEPSQDLIEVADEVNADFIVIGLRRRTPVGKLILGSNAQRILLDASCPVLAVKASDNP